MKLYTQADKETALRIVQRYGSVNAASLAEVRTKIGKMISERQLRNWYNDITKPKKVTKHLGESVYQNAANDSNSGNAELSSIAAKLSNMTPQQKIDFIRRGAIDKLAMSINDWSTLEAKQVLAALDDISTPSDERDPQLQALDTLLGQLIDVLKPLSRQDEHYDYSPVKIAQHVLEDVITVWSSLTPEQLQEWHNRKYPTFTG